MSYFSNLGSLSSSLLNFASLVESLMLFVNFWFVSLDAAETDKGNSNHCSKKQDQHKSSVGLEDRGRYIADCHHFNFTLVFTLLGTVLFTFFSHADC